MNMTMKGKVLVALLVLSVVGVGVWRFWDKIAPAPKSAVISLDTKAVNAKLNDAKGGVVINPIKAALDKLLAGTNAIALAKDATIPAISGVSAYDKSTKNGKLLVRFPINIWPGWAAIIMANNGMAANDESVFYKKYGFYVDLLQVDDPVKARDLFASGYCHVLWGTLDMMALFAPALCTDSRTVPVICQQIDWSQGGDGCVGRNGIRSVNDLRIKNGVKRRVVMAQNSPSQFFFMSMIINANVDPAEIEFIWTADAMSAAKLFVQDSTIDAFVGWSPDIYTVSDMVPGTHMIVDSSRANHVIADVWAVRNDFYKDNPKIVTNLVDGILEGLEMVRKNPTKAAELVKIAYGLQSVDDALLMIGKDGGIVSGDAHLTNYRENHNFFILANNPWGFDATWNKANVIYQSIGVIEKPVAAGMVKNASIILGLADKYKDSIDLSQPNFDPNMVFKTMELDENSILTAPVMVLFAPNSWKVIAPTNNYAMNPTEGNRELDKANYARNLSNVSNINKIVEISADFGNAYIKIEGNTDSSMKGTVPAESLQKLSQDRADAVKDYLVTTYTNIFDPNKFKTVGNGWNNNLPNCTDPSNKEHNFKNRRTEIKVFPLEN